MGTPCCDKTKVKRGPWSPEEHSKLRGYIEKYGNGGNWISFPLKAGLRRCGKSCRLRWLNYLRPNIKHGDFSEEEDRIIFSLFAAIGSRGFLPARSATGFLSEVYSLAADEVEKIFLIADDSVRGAVFDLPEDIAKDLLEKEMPEENGVSMITKLPPLQDDGPSSDNYGRFSYRDRMPRRGGGSRGSRFGGRGGSSRGRDIWGGDDKRRGRSSGGGGSSWSRGGGGGSRGSSDDWLIGGGSYRRSSPAELLPGRGACFSCGSSRHRAADCPDKRGF